MQSEHYLAINSPKIGYYHLTNEWTKKTVKQICMQNTYIFYLTEDGDLLMAGTLNEKDGFDIQESELFNLEPIKMNFLKSFKVALIATTKSTVHFTTKEGLFFSWGSDPDETGILGLGATKIQNNPILIPNLSEMRIKTFHLSEKHGGAIDMKGKLYFWGTGSYGELGTNDKCYLNKPEMVKSQKIFNAAEIRCYKNCSAIITVGGYLFFFGKLSNVKENYNLASPNQALIDFFIQKIMIFDNFSLALDSSGHMHYINENFESFQSNCSSRYLNMARSKNNIMIITEQRKLFSVGIETLQKCFKNSRNFNLSSHLQIIDIDPCAINPKFLNYSDTCIFIKMETKRSLRQTENLCSLKLLLNVNKIENIRDGSSFMPLSPKSLNLDEIFINAPTEKSFVSNRNNENKENQNISFFREKSISFQPNTSKPSFSQIKTILFEAFEQAPTNCVRQNKFDPEQFFKPIDESFTTNRKNLEIHKKRLNERSANLKKRTELLSLTNRTSFKKEEEFSILQPNTKRESYIERINVEGRSEKDLEYFMNLINEKKKEQMILSPKEKKNSSNFHIQKDFNKKSFLDSSSISTANKISKPKINGQEENDRSSNDIAKHFSSISELDQVLSPKSINEMKNNFNNLKNIVDEVFKKNFDSHQVEHKSERNNFDFSDDSFKNSKSKSNVSHNLLIKTKISNLLEVFEGEGRDRGTGTNEKFLTLKRKISKFQGGKKNESDSRNNLISSQNESKLKLNQVKNIFSTENEENLSFNQILTYRREKTDYEQEQDFFPDFKNISDSPEKLLNEISSSQRKLRNVSNYSDYQNSSNNHNKIESSNELYSKNKLNDHLSNNIKQMGSGLFNDGKLNDYSNDRLNDSNSNNCNQMNSNNGFYSKSKMNDNKLGLAHDFYSNSKFNNDNKKEEKFVSEKNSSRNRKLNDFWREEGEKNEEISFNGFGVEQKKNCKRMITFGFEEIEQGSSDVRHLKKGDENNDERSSDVKVGRFFINDTKAKAYSKPKVSDSVHINQRTKMLRFILNLQKCFNNQKRVNLNFMVATLRQHQKQMNSSCLILIKLLLNLYRKKIGSGLNKLVYYNIYIKGKISSSLTSIYFMLSKQINIQKSLFLEKLKQYVIANEHDLFYRKEQRILGLQAVLNKIGGKSREYLRKSFLKLKLFFKVKNGQLRGLIRVVNLVDKKWRDKMIFCLTLFKKIWQEEEMIKIKMQQRYQMLSFLFKKIQKLHSYLFLETTKKFCLYKIKKEHQDTLKSSGLNNLLFILFDIFRKKMKNHFFQLKYNKIMQAKNTYGKNEIKYLFNILQNKLTSHKRIYFSILKRTACSIKKKKLSLKEMMLKIEDLNEHQRILGLSNPETTKLSKNQMKGSSCKTKKFEIEMMTTILNKIFKKKFISLLKKMRKNNKIIAYQEKENYKKPPRNISKNHKNNTQSNFNNIFSERNYHNNIMKREKSSRKSENNNLLQINQNHEPGYSEIYKKRSRKNSIEFKESNVGFTPDLTFKFEEKTSSLENISFINNNSNSKQNLQTNGSEDILIPSQKNLNDSDLSFLIKSVNYNLIDKNCYKKPQGNNIINEETNKDEISLTPLRSNLCEKFNELDKKIKVPDLFGSIHQDNNTSKINLDNNIFSSEVNVPKENENLQYSKEENKDYGLSDPIEYVESNGYTNYFDHAKTITSIPTENNQFFQMVSPKINENKRFFTQNFCTSQKNIYCSLVQYQSISPQDKLFKFNQTKNSESKFENYLKDYKNNDNTDSNNATFKNYDAANTRKNANYKDDPNTNYSSLKNNNCKSQKSMEIIKHANYKYDNRNQDEKLSLNLNFTNNCEISYFDSVSSKFYNSTNNAYNNNNNYKKVIENQKKFLGNRNKLIYNTIAGRSTSPNYLSYQDYLKEKKAEFK